MSSPRGELGKWVLAVQAWPGARVSGAGGRELPVPSLTCSLGFPATGQEWVPRWEPREEGVPSRLDPGTF